MASPKIAKNSERADAHEKVIQNSLYGILGWYTTNNV